MNEVLVRSLTGLVYIAATVGAALAGPFTTLLLFLPVALIAAGELHRLTWRTNDAPPVFWTRVLAGCLFLVVGVAPIISDWRVGFVLLTAFLLVLLTMGLTLFRRGDAPVQELAGQVFVLIYVALPFGLVPLVVARGWELFLGFMVLLWTSDTGAYVVGRLIGRHPLFPRVSPKKTIEGLLGGVAFTLLAAWIIARFWTTLDLADWLVLAVVVTITGTLGDLLESAFKRAAGVKDSGTLLPGHGGILDRFDGFLLAMPATWVYLQAIA
ncbi:MAG: phosphatidate cytidylyltransferase [Flavobacteriales bacterium]|nr:phosphatidate cytidylyltransferase [Flavobacteriales bacterium]